MSLIKVKAWSSAQAFYNACSKEEKKEFLNHCYNTVDRFLPTYAYNGKCTEKYPDVPKGYIIP